MQQRLQSPTWVIRAIIMRPVDLGRASCETETSTTFRPVAALCSVLAIGLGWLIGGWFTAVTLPIGMWLLFWVYHGTATVLGGRGRWLALAGAMSRMLVVALPAIVLLQLTSMLLFFASPRLGGLGDGILLAVQIVIVAWAMILATSLLRGVYELSWGRALLAALLAQMVFPILISLVRPLILAAISR